MNQCLPHRHGKGLSPVSFLIHLHNGVFQDGPYRGKRLTSPRVSRSFLHFLIVENHLTPNQALQVARECLRRQKVKPGIFTYYDPDKWVGGGGPNWQPVAERIVREAEARKAARAVKQARRVGTEGD